MIRSHRNLQKTRPARRFFGWNFFKTPADNFWRQDWGLFPHFLSLVFRNVIWGQGTPFLQEIHRTFFPIGWHNRLELFGSEVEWSTVQVAARWRWWWRGWRWRVVLWFIRRLVVVFCVIKVERVGLPCTIFSFLYLRWELLVAVGSLLTYGFEFMTASADECH